VVRLSGLGFVCGSVLALIWALVTMAGTDLAPGRLFGLVVLGGVAGAALLAVVANLRNVLVK
jgi:hypothetical protein